MNPNPAGDTFGSGPDLTSGMNASSTSVASRSFWVRNRRADTRVFSMTRPISVVRDRYSPIAHNQSGNMWNPLRRIVYYRFTAAGHRERWRETQTDALLEFEPVRAALPQRTPADT